MVLQRKALVLAAVLGIYSCDYNKTESVDLRRTDYDSLVIPIIEKSFDELNADSIAVYIYSGASAEQQWSNMYRKNGNQLNQSVIPFNRKFEPASLIKPYWASILVENDLVKLSDSIPYEAKSKFYDRIISDPFNISFKYMTLAKAIKYSSNTSMARFLFVNASQPCVENEVKKMIDPVLRSGITLPWAAMGYGVLIPVSDLMDFYYQVANRIETTKFSNGTLVQMDSLLSEVLMTGSAQNLYSQEIPINGMTATFQNSQSGPSEGRFIGYSPKDPSVVVMVRVFNSSPNFYGLLTASPIVEQMLKVALSKVVD